MATKKELKEHPLICKNREGRERAWDDLYAKEEGIIIEFDTVSSKGRLRSLVDNSIYDIAGPEAVRTECSPRQGDRVIFAPIEETAGTDCARVIRIVGPRAGLNYLL